MNFGTWNIRTLYQVGALQATIREVEKYEMNIVALQEMRWPGQGKLKKKNWDIYYSGTNNNAHVFGVGFMVGKTLRDKVISFNPMNERICYIRIKMKFNNISLFTVHAPTEDKEEVIKDQFYSQVEREMDKCPDNDIKILMGDFNAKVGKERAHIQITGKHSLHDNSNDNGERLIDFSAGRNLVIRSTTFPHRQIHKGTWTSPDGKTINQIDHILISARHFSSISDVRTMRGAASDSDHFLVRARVREKIDSTRVSPEIKTPKYNLEKLKEGKTLMEYQQEIDRKFKESGDEIVGLEIDQIWERFKSNISQATTKTLGTEQRRPKDTWWDNDCEEAMNRRNDARKILLNRHTRLSQEKYKETRKAAKRICRRKKREKLDERLRNMEHASQAKDSKTLFKILKNTKNEYHPRLVLCKDKEGRCITEQSDILKRWKEYFTELLTRNGQPDRAPYPPYQSAQPQTAEPTLEEVRESTTNMSNDKAPGVDNIPAELIKYGGKQTMEQLHRLILEIWRTEKMPTEWNTSIICPVYKKGERLNCNNYRGISLLPAAYKIFSNIVKKRITVYADDIIGEYQAGFRKNRSTTDQIFTIRQIMEKGWEHNTPIYQLLVDFKQAYDCIDREALYAAMEELGIPHKLVKLTRITMVHSNCQVKIQNKLTDNFVTDIGLRQGDGLAPILFNLVLEKVIREMKIHSAGTIATKSYQIVGYADDMNIVGRTVSDVKETYCKLEEEARKVGLVVNEEKTKLLPMKQTRRLGQYLTVEGKNFEIVQEFKYLGSNLNTCNDLTREIQNRIIAGNKAYYALRNTFRSSLVNQKTKIRIYQATVRSITTYGCQCWTLTKQMEETLLRFERKILRRIFGAFQEEDGWRIRYNYELAELYKSPDIVRYVKILKLKWAGHLTRMEETRAPKRIYKAQFEGRRTRGRPRQRWRDNVEADAREVLGIRSWERIAKEREDWRNRIRQAQVH